jgi:ELWxxDGT repeat protein
MEKRWNCSRNYSGKKYPGLDIPFELTEVKGNLFFRIFYGTGELWKSDGTTAGTASLLTVPGSSPMQAPLELTAVNETLFFVGYDTANGDELWKYGGGNSPSGPLSFIKVLGTGYEFSAALCEDGTVRAWGDNGTGSLGTGNNIYYNYPAKVVDLTDIIDISSGLYHTVALKKDGTVWAWGDNYHGQCGNGTFSLNGYKTPVQVIGLSDIITVAAGENHNLALKKDGTVWAWGENDAGQLGDGTTTKSSFAKKVNGISGMTAIAGGMSFSIALKGDGTVWSWGLNYNGQLGDGTKTNRHTPVQVQGLTGIISIAAAKLSHVLALKNDKTVWGWGANSRGQLGNGSTAPEVKLPVQMNISGVNAVSTGATFSLMLKNDGTLWGCGYNSFDGTLGINTSNSEHHNPIQVSNITGVKAMSAGTAHSLAVLNDGSVWAWGRNNFGQIGDETDATRLAPVIVEKMCKVVPGLEEPQKIASGLNIYPNPSSGKFTIKVQDDKRQISNAKVLVYNVIGETVYQSTEQTLDEAKIDLGYQPRGIYFYKITSKKGSLLGSGKLVVTY